MKTLFTISLTLLFTISSYANEIDNVTNTIEKYADYDNKYNASGLEKVTDESFHFILHGNGETETVRTISREAFLKGIEAKQFGGNDKKLEIKNINIKENIANVYFTHTGTPAAFHHFMNLIRLNGEWKAVSTVAHIEVF